MDPTLSIVACPPVGDGKDDDTIKALLALLEPIAADPAKQHELARASSVEALRAVLEKPRLVAPKVIQIFGHGLPGALWLGRTWTNTYGEGPNGPIYVLDSVPYYYGILLGQVPLGAEVLLLGCTVGENKTAASADGPTVLFDLATMWERRVSAPVGVFGVDDLDATGRCKATVVLARAEGNCYQPPMTVPPPPPPTIGPGVASVSFVRLLALPGLGPRTIGPVPILGGADLDLAHAAEVATRPLLAAPEAIYEVRLGSSMELVRAEVLANSRLLRVRTGPLTRTFLVSPLARDRFCAAQRRLVASVLTPP